MNISIELEDWMAAAIAAQAQDLGCSESEVVIKALKLMLGIDENTLNQILESLLESKLEQKLEVKLNALLETKLKVLEHQLIEKLDKKLSKKLTSDIKEKDTQKLQSPKPEQPTIRPLQVGDVVQIRDQSSPHFLEKLIIIKVGMLRATVQTDTGEESFLKRDLRFTEL